MSPPRAPRGAVLASAAARSGMPPDVLWLRYLAVGGLAGPVELEAYLAEALEIDRHEHDRVAAALNDHFVERGQDHPVPYADPEAP